MRRVYTSLATKLGAIGNSFKNKTHIYCLSGETIHTAAGVKQTREGIATIVSYGASSVLAGPCLALLFLLSIRPI